MFCTKCGEQIKSGGKFCPKCGAPLKGTLAETQRRESFEEAVQQETPGKKKGLGSVPMIVVLVLLILLLLAGISGGVYYFLTHSREETSRIADDEEDGEEGIEQEPDEDAEETESQHISSEEDTPEVIVVFTEDAAETQDAWMDADYILDFSAWREVTEEDLEGLSPEQLRIARNEIFARHGRQFRDDALNQWFYEKGWYLDISKKYLPEEFDSLSPNPLSDLERRNAVFIGDYEKKLEEMHGEEDMAD